MCLPAEMDRLGASTTQSGFSYFSRTSTKLCDCIAAKHDFEKLAELCLHIEKIDNRRLRRALEGALFANAINRYAPESRIESLAVKLRFSRTDVVGSNRRFRLKCTQTDEILGRISNLVLICGNYLSGCPFFSNPRCIHFAVAFSYGH